MMDQAAQGESICLDLAGYFLISGLNLTMILTSSGTILSCWLDNNVISFLFYLSFVAKSTGNQISSRLLSMKSADALLELPAAGGLIPAGTSVSAIIISDLIDSTIRRNFVSSNSASTEKKAQGKPVDELNRFKVAVLTVSDTVASGAGPDRRYSTCCFVIVQ